MTENRTSNTRPVGGKGEKYKFRKFVVKWLRNFKVNKISRDTEKSEPHCTVGFLLKILKFFCDLSPHCAWPVVRWRYSDMPKPLWARSLSARWKGEPRDGAHHFTKLTDWLHLTNNVTNAVKSRAEETRFPRFYREVCTPLRAHRGRCCAKMCANVCLARL